MPIYRRRRYNPRRLAINRDDIYNAEEHLTNTIDIATKLLVSSTVGKPFSNKDAVKAVQAANEILTQSKLLNPIPEPIYRTTKQKAKKGKS